MDQSSIQLPSDKKFGLFFGLVFLIGAGYLFTYGYHSYAGGAAFAVSAVFLIFSIARPSALHLLNVGWMRLGLLIGRIVSPVVLGIIFFCVFTPLAVVMRIGGRDELGMKRTGAKSFWRVPQPRKFNSSFFKNQF